MNLLPAVLASTKARRLLADEAVFVKNGVITECAHSNISILKNGELFTHPQSRRILPGIQRKELISTCQRLQIPVNEVAFSVQDLLCADEILVTSSSRLCQRASAVDGISAGGKDKALANKILDEIFSSFPHA